MTADVSSYHFIAEGFSELSVITSIGSGSLTIPMDMPHKITLPSRGRKGGKGEQKMEDLNHVCRVCSRRFGCGKALGGHMRIHGAQLNAADETVHPQKKKKRKVSEIGGSDSLLLQAWHEDKSVNEVPSSHSSDLLRDIEGTSTSNSESEQVAMHMHRDLSSNPWMKGWRSKRPRYVIEQALSTNADEDVANCLVMLSTAEGSWRPPKTQLSEPHSKLGYYNYVSGSKDLKNACEYKRTEKSEDSNPEEEEADEGKISSSGGSLYECQTCNKVFSSHRALGGHRASHKKVKGCCMEQEQAKNKVTDEVESEESLHAICSDKTKVHECPICHKIFGSGQALGGHKRCHWIASPSPSSSSPKQQQEKERETERPVLLDLNLPAPVEDDEVDGLKPCNLFNSMEAHNKISSYAQQWWIDSHYRILSIPVNGKFEDKGNFKPKIHRPWLQVVTKTA